MGGEWARTRHKPVVPRSHERGGLPGLQDGVDQAVLDRGLRGQVLETSRRLAELDVARWRPEIADEVMALGRPVDLAPPPGVPARCAELAVRAARCLAIVRLAATDDGAAVSSYEMEARADALRPLDSAARRGLVAACSPEVWPTE